MGLHPTLGHNGPLCQFTKLRVVEKSHLETMYCYLTVNVEGLKNSKACIKQFKTWMWRGMIRLFFMYLDKHIIEDKRIDFRGWSILLGAVPSQLQDLGDKILQGGGHDHRRLNPNL